MASNSISDLKPNEILSPLYKTKRKQYAMLLDRFEQYSVKPHISALKEHEKELDKMKLRKDRRNILQQRMEACRVLQQVRVDLVDLARIKEQAHCLEDVEYFSVHGEPMRIQLIRAVAAIYEKHPEINKPTQEQDDVRLTEDEKIQGYALAAEEMEREKDRMADKEDLLLRVQTINNVRLRLKESRSA